MAIIDLAEKHARRHGAVRVAAIHLVAGENCGYLPECIEMYFDLIAAGGMCAGAVLSFETVEALLRCRACGHLFRRRPFEFSCPVAGCGGEGSPTEIGREFYVKSIAIENDRSE